MRRVGQITVDSPEKFMDVCDRFGDELFVYRGHGNKDWSIENSIERLAERYGLERKYLMDRERHLFGHIKERVHHHVTHIPDKNNQLEWAAIIQHYGGPTRLLDVTHSFWVAAFFAIEKPEKDVDTAVWAFRVSSFGKIQRGGMKEIFKGKHIPKRPGVKLAKPHRLNERIVAQQGLFIVPQSLEVSLEEQLQQTLDTNLCNIEEFKTAADIPIMDMRNVWKIILTSDMQSRMARHLKRNNITAATVYPGVDGIGRSLNLIMRLND